MDVNESHGDDNGGSQREKVKRVWQVSSWHCIFHPQLWIENRDTCSTKESNELFSGQEIGKAHLLDSEESRQNPSRSFWARRKWRKQKHLQEKWKRSDRRVWEFQGDREEERGWCFVGRSSGKISLACQNLWCAGHPSYPVHVIGRAKDL